MKIKSSYLVLASIIIILILTSYAYFVYNRSKNDISTPETQPETETSYRIDPAYPIGLIEGFIRDAEIELPGGEFKVEVNINKIFLEDIIFTKEVTVLTDEKTVFSIHNMETEKETQASIEDFSIGTAVVIAIKGDNRNILTQDTFVSTKITKMVSSSNISQ